MRLWRPRNRQRLWFNWHPLRSQPGAWARGEPLMCQAHPEDCPLGPGPHPFVAPDQTNGLCCCRQPWEDEPPERRQASGPGWPRKDPPGPVVHASDREWSFDQDDRWWIKAGDLWYPSFPETMGKDSD